MKRQRTLFNIFGAVGILLSLVLIVDAVVTYFHVSGHLAEDHLTREAGRYISELEVMARNTPPTGTTELLDALERFRQMNAGQIAWLRIADHEGRILAASGDSPVGPLRVEIVQALLDQRVQSVSKELIYRDTVHQVATLPFRFRFEGERSLARPADAPAGRPRFKLVEIGLQSPGSADPFGPLRRNLLISLTAAGALFVAMIGLLLLMGQYVRHRELQQQLRLARRVQAELLPATCPECHPLDFAAEFRPYWEVGGDFYDLFQTDDGQTVILMGDVSGKGLPAALLMGVVHGAIHAYARAGMAADLARLAGRLNTQMHDRTGGRHFITLFWGMFDPHSGLLRYVNAGHHPPLLVTHAPAETAPQRLETGGPVIGLLPEGEFEEGMTTLRPGDTLILFSDGLVEAENAAGEAFGESRIADTLLSCHRHTAREIRDRVIAAALDFTGHTAPHDDLSLLVAQVRPPVVPSSGK